MRHPRDSARDAAGRLLYWAGLPLSFYWALIVFCLAGALLLGIRERTVPWEALLSAATLAGVVELLARVQGCPAWPCRRS